MSTHNDNDKTQKSDMQTQNGERLGTFMLMSPILMLRGISGRFIFFTAETARAGAADRPPCQKNKKISLYHFYLEQINRSVFNIYNLFLKTCIIKKDL